MFLTVSRQQYVRFVQAMPQLIDQPVESLSLSVMQHVNPERNNRLAAQAIYRRGQAPEYRVDTGYWRAWQAANR